MSKFLEIVRKYPDSLEARIIQYLIPFRARLQRVSSELQASASPPPEVLNGKHFDLENFETQLRFNFRKKLPYFVCFSLACLSWWIDEEEDLGKIIRFLLEEEVDRFPDYGHELQLALSSKAECLLFLQEKYYGRYEDLFSSIFTLKWSWVDPHTGGNVVRTFFEIAPRTFWIRKKKPRPVQRKRGYRDHGSLGDQGTIARREEWKKDYSNQEEEELIEENRRTRRSLFELLRGWFQ